MTDIKDGKLKDLNARAENAQARYEEGEKTLFRSDGSKLYSEDEHRQQVRALEQERNGVLSDIEQQTHEMRMAVASEIERIENADPADMLTSEELEQANQKRAFALDAAESLGTEALKKRLESVLAGDDRGSIFAYLMAGQRKAEDIRQQRRKALTDAGRPAASGARVTDLDEVLGKMEAALGGDSRDAEIEAAKRKEEEAMQVGLSAGYLKAGARSAAEAQLKKRYAGYRQTGAA